MLNQEELKNLEVVFAFARQAVVGNEEQLIGVINFKKQLFDKLTPKPVLTPAPEEKTEEAAK